jgi:cbb3-type cytochrome oxidase maturation protein
MTEAALAQIILTILLLIIFLGFFVWGLKSGQFNNIEEAKYHVFMDNAKKKTGKSKTANNNPDNMNSADRKEQK